MSEAEKISENCIECGICIDNCEFLSKYCKSPRELAKKAIATSFKEKPSIPYCCTLCELCEVQCPEDLNIGRMCLETRQALVTEGIAPLTPHKIIKKDQAWNLSEEFSLTLPNPEEQQVSTVFFPGCHLSAYSPDLVVSVYDWLREQMNDIGIILSCCGSQTNYIGDSEAYQNILADFEAKVNETGAEEIICACPNCLKHFKRYAPHLKTKSLYEAMVELGPMNVAAATDATFTIHDPCPARWQSEIHDSIRTIIGWTGCQIVEMSQSRDNTECCGLGGGIAYISPQLAGNSTKKRVEQLPADVITYCASCREVFAPYKPSLHVLDLVFNPNWEEAKVKQAKKPSEKKDYQKALRAQLLEKYSDRSRSLDVWLKEDEMVAPTT